GVQKVDVTIAVKGKSAKASRLALTIASATGEYTQRVVRVPAGTSSVKVPLTVPADGVYNPGSGGVVSISPLRNAAATSYLGTVQITSDAPIPEIQFPTTHVEV